MRLRSNIWEAANGAPQHLVPLIVGPPLPKYKANSDSITYLTFINSFSIYSKCMEYAINAVPQSLVEGQ